MDKILSIASPAGTAPQNADLLIQRAEQAVTVTSRLNTERSLREHEMAEEIRILKARLSEMDCRKNKFLATLAHELRNPLAPISNAIQVMRLSGRLAEGIPELLDVLERQTSHLIQLVDDLVEMHDSQTSALSEEPGNESLFEATLPMSSMEVIMAGAICESSQAQRINSVRRLIIVDDMRATRITLERLLTSMGQDVRSLESGKLAYEAAMSDPPDFLVSDIGMPEMDGFELARKIRSEPKLRNVILVALTGFGQGISQKRAKEAGFDCQLTKPVRVDDLRQLLVQ
jgi:CheY-like chemotaxis protein